MSEAGTASCPAACSGEMYWAVPITIPILVTGAWWATLAMPKSVILTWPPGVISRLPGLMSRCTRDRACACCSARPVWSSTSSVRDGGQPAGPGQHDGQRLARDQFHHQVGGAAQVAAGPADHLAVVVDRGDARVVQRRGDPGLGAEPFDELRIAGQLGPQDLQRDHPGQPDVVGGPHLAHAADRDQVVQPVAAGQQQAGRGHHGAPGQRGGDDRPADRSRRPCRRWRPGRGRRRSRPSPRPRPSGCPRARRPRTRRAAGCSSDRCRARRCRSWRRSPGRRCRRSRGCPSRTRSSCRAAGRRRRSGSPGPATAAESRRSPSGPAWWSWRSGAAPSCRRGWRWSR